MVFQHGITQQLLCFVAVGFHCSEFAGVRASRVSKLLYGFEPHSQNN